MRNTTLQETIKRVLKSKKKLVTIDELLSLTNIEQIQKESSQKLYKTIYYLKQRGYLISLKKDIFVLKDPEEQISESDAVDTRYRHILQQQCSKQFQQKFYIGGEVALALQLNQYTIPDNISIINQKKQGYETIVTGKKIQYKTYTHQQQNISSKIMKWTHKQTIQGIVFSIANLPLAMLETLYNNDPKHPLILDLIKKTLKKNKEFALEEFHAILKLGKHHSSINHLYSIAKEHHPKLATGLAEVIKKWSFFL